MQFTLGLKERINLGGYEFIEIAGSVVFDIDESNGSPAELAVKQLDLLLLPHRERARDLIPDGTESYILYHPALQEPT